jgi:hypothetical protein
MDFKTASLGELLTYWERRRLLAVEKLSHLYALLEGEEDEMVSASEATPGLDEPLSVKEPAPLPKPVELTSTPIAASGSPALTKAADRVEGSVSNTLGQTVSNTLGQMHALLPAFIDAQSGTFTRREMMDYLEAHGLQVSRQNMHHAVSTLRKKGLIVEQAAAPGAPSKYVYAKRIPA